MSDSRTHGMTLLVASAFALVVVLQVPVHAAGSYSYVSGPDGGVLRNGWYLYPEGSPTLTIRSNGESKCGGTGTWTSGLAFGGGDSMGSHKVRIFYAPDDAKDNLWVARDGVTLGTLCNQDTSFTGDTVTVWEGTLKFEGWAPVVSIKTANNTNTRDSSIVISGVAYDTGDDYKAKCMVITRCSLIATVIVNGISASISGDTFSAVIPLEKGLNTISAVATDNAGYSSKSEAVTVFRSDEVAKADRPQQSPTVREKDARTPTGGSVASGETNSQDKGAGEVVLGAAPSPSPSPSPNSETITLVKGVARTGGIGLASLLAFIVALLLLDRLGVVEIKGISAVRRIVLRKKSDHY